MNINLVELATATLLGTRRDVVGGILPYKDIV